MSSRRPLLIIFLAVFIDLLGFAIVLPLLPRYGKHFLAPDQEWVLGPLMASFSAMQFLFAPLWGRLSDRIGRRPVLLVGLAGSVVFYWLFGWITARGNTGDLYGLSPITWLFISRIGAGIAGATITTAQAYIADSTDVKNRGKGMALIGAAFGAGFTFGPLLGAAFVTKELDAPPSPWPGYVASLLSLAALLLAITYLPESLKSRTQVRPRQSWFGVSRLAHALRQPFIAVTLVGIFLSTLAFAQFETTLAVVTGDLGLDDSQNLYVFAFVGLVLTLSQGILIRPLLPRFGEWKMGVAGCALMTVGLLSMVVLVSAKSITLLALMLPLVVVGYSSTTPSLNAFLSLNSAEDEQGGSLGFGQSASALARILGPLLAYGLRTHDRALPYWVGGGVMAVSLVLIAGGLRRARSSLSHGGEGQ